MKSVVPADRSFFEEPSVFVEIPFGTTPVHDRTPAHLGKPCRRIRDGGVFSVVEDMRLLDDHGDAAAFLDDRSFKCGSQDLPAQGLCLNRGFRLRLALEPIPPIGMAENDQPLSPTPGERR